MEPLWEQKVMAVSFVFSGMIVCSTANKDCESFLVFGDGRGKGKKTRYLFILLERMKKL